MKKIKALIVDLSNNFYDRHAVYALTASLSRINAIVNYTCPDSFNQAFDLIKTIQPDIILYSAWSNNLFTYAKFDKKLKEKIKIISVVGGAGPTFGYKNLSETSFDFICLGEGDLALPEFFRNGFNPIKNIIRLGQEPESFFDLADLNQIPVPDRSLVYKADLILRDMKAKQFLSGRGCPYVCSYCYNHVFNKMFSRFGQIIRKKSPDRLIKEILEIKQNYGLSRVVFQDDTFILDKDWLKEFALMYSRQINLPYTCNIRANLVDQDTVKLLKQSNCAGVNWSIESGDDYMRNQVLNRGISRQQIIDTANLLNQYKIHHRVASLLGLPGETKEQMHKSLQLAIQVKPYYGFANTFVPFPELEITKYACEKGFLNSDFAKKLPKSFYCRSILNFTEQEKIYISKLVFLFPLFVRFPFLWKINWIRKLVFSGSVRVFKFIFHLIDGWSMFWLYRPGFSIFRWPWVIIRYFKNA